MCQVSLVVKYIFWLCVFTEDNPQACGLFAYIDAQAALARGLSPTIR